MKVSWRWLSELVDLEGVSPDEAIRLLPLRVVDVEGVERLGGLDGVVTARVVKVEPHPGADRLRLCTVDRGEASSGAVPAGVPAPLRVVCGAPNVAEGQVVCFASVGVTLPGGVTLKKAKIRGVESEGMICAEDELGLGTSHDGILVLPPGTPLGIPVAEALGLADTVLDLNNSGLTNRPDMWGHVGVAREVAAIFSRHLRPPPIARAEAAVRAASGPELPVEIRDALDCRRYVGIVVEGLVNGPSPAALRRRLEGLGARSVDLLVDLTNLVLHEGGQPLHAFDLRALRGGRVIVRRAAAGERLVTLDGKDLALDPEDLVIADAEGPVALAGVMGGQASAVRADTTSVLIESACFDAARVRRAAIRHGLRTDASARFEKSLDPAGALPAALRFVALALEHVPSAKVSRRPSDAFPRPYPSVVIDLPSELVRRRLGLDLPDGEIVARLESVGFRCERVPGGHRVTVPSWRATKDVALPEDLVEEVGRLHGYEHVVPTAPLAPMTPHRPSPARALERDARAVACLDLGYGEISAHAFHGAVEARRLGIDPERLLRLVNPLSAAEDRLQLTTAQNLLGAAARNQAREAVLRLVEWSRVFPKADRAARSLPSETPVMGLLLAERDRRDDPRGEVFLAAKEDVRALLGRLGLPEVEVSDAGEAHLADALPPPAWLHPGRRAALRSGGVVVALVGEVRPEVAQAFALEGRVALGEINLARALATGRPGGSYRPVPRFPEAPFDVAVIVPRKTPAAEVERILRGAAGKSVREVVLFDEYVGPGIPEGHRSLAFTVTFGDDAGTLEPKVLERLERRVVEVLGRAGFTVRTTSATAAPPPDLKPAP